MTTSLVPGGITCGDSENLIYQVACSGGSTEIRYFTALAVFITLRPLPDQVAVQRAVHEKQATEVSTQPCADIFPPFPLHSLPDMVWYFQRVFRILNLERSGSAHKLLVVVPCPPPRQRNR